MMLVKALLLGLAVAAVSGHGYKDPQAENCTVAESCGECNIPDCLCSGESTQVDVDKRPQIIYLSYDDAFTEYAMNTFYSGIFDDKFFNPDGCPIRSTHFLTAQYTDFTHVHEYWVRGHEMASHSVTHRTDQKYWKGMNVDGWIAEAEGMRRMISQFAAIPKEDIKGFRAPFLQIGGDEMFTALSKMGFSYDCSWASRNFGYLDLDVGLFPYTLDYKTIQDCPIAPCPKCSYPGFWVQPMLDLEDNWIGANPQYPDNGMPCSMLDGCIIIQEDADRKTVFDMLNKNFLRNRDGSRAPIGLYVHAAWFFGEQKWHFDGYLDFLQHVTKEYDDVWIVPVAEGIDYVKNFNDKSNADLLALGEDSPFSCKKFEGRKNQCDPLSSCRFEKVNNEDIHNEERYMHICGRLANGQKQSCPAEYPWISNPCGGNLPCA